MSQVVVQSEYSDAQMQMLLGELKKHPELQTAMLEYITDNNIVGSQSIAALMHERLLAAQESAEKKPANQFAGITGLNGVVSDELRALNAPGQSVQVASVLPGKQRTQEQSGGLV